MKKDYTKKLIGTLALALAIGLSSVSVQAQKAYVKKDSTTVAGSFLNAIRAQKMIFGAINAADNGKDQDLLIFKVGSETSSPYTFTGIELYKNNGTGTYTLNSSAFTSLKSGNGAWSKIDGNIVTVGLDGANADAKTTILYKRNGSGAYVKITNPVEGTSNLPGITGFVGFIDFNNDGLDDIFLADNATGDSYLYQNLGADQYTLVSNPVDGTAGFPVMILNSYQVTGVAFGDYNKDGKTDILISAKSGADKSTAYTSIYKNNGDGTFSKASITLDGNPGFPGLYAGSIDFGDLDSDGFATDIAVQGNSTGDVRTFKVFKQDAVNPDEYTTVLSYSGGSTGQFTHEGGKRYGQVIFGDLTGSGFKKDLITTGQTAAGYVTTEVFIYDNTAQDFTVYSRYGSAPYPVNTANFASFIWDYASNSNYRFFAFGDINGDGKKNDVAKFGVPSNTGGTASIAALYSFERSALEMTSPSDNINLKLTDNVLLKIDAPEPVQKVEFYVNGAKVGEKTAAPYEYTLGGLVKGVYSIFARIYYPDADVKDTKNLAVAVGNVLLPEADTYANGGSSANTNFGADSRMVVKKDGTSYYRESYLRFNLTDLVETSYGAVKLKLNEIRTNSGVTPSQTWQLYFIADDTWGETTLTYNNRPTVIGNMMTEIPQVKVVGGVPVPMEWDITPYVNTELSGDKKISMLLVGSTTNGTGDADFASKENDNISLRPLLQLYTTAEVLPVNFISFNAQADGNRAKLTWSTASEHNNAYFEVEKSTDGINFSLLTKVTAQGNSTATANYSTYDNNPAQTTYYRLSQVDNNGTKATLGSVVVAFKLDKAIKVSTYPNPATTQISLNITAYTGKVLVTVKDVNGKSLKQYAGNASQGQALVFDVSDLASGIYFFEVSGNNFKQTEKVIVK